MSQSKPLLQRFGFPASPSISSTSSASSTYPNSLRAAYTMDNCGHELSYRYSKPKNPEKVKTSNPFKRAAYTLDGQGFDLSLKYPYTEGDTTPSSEWSIEQKGFRSLYTMDWKPCNFVGRA